MRAIPALSVDHTSRRILSAFASFAVALTMVRFAFGQQPGEGADDPDLLG
jgi:hypothetical protein